MSDSVSFPAGRPKSAPYGQWTSPITARMVAASALRLGGVAAEGGNTYWVEGRPQDAGRSVIVMRRGDGAIVDLTPPGTNVRTRVHEYGGGAYVVCAGTIYYSEFVDQRVYRLRPGGTPEPMTPPGDCYFADYSINRSRRSLVCVREDHTERGREAVTTLVSLPLDGPPTAGRVIVSGHDFYSTPRFSPDGSRLAWLAWRHPQMPWDGTELWVADVAADGAIERARRVAGSETESIFQPGWSPDGTLYFVSDRSGWWNLYRARGGEVEAVHPMASEFGRPQWQLATSTWAFADASRLVVTYAQDGRWRLAIIDVETGVLTPIALDVEPADSIAATRTHAILLGGSPQTPDAVLCVDLATGMVETVRAVSTLQVHSDFFSTPEAIEFPTDEGLAAHAFYYAPHNRDFGPPPDERPPLIVIAHGGPTAAANTRLNLEVQFWTSRGFAVADVNYGGSAAYGRAYRQRLTGNWGIVDVADCANAAKHLVAQAKADAGRLIIRGRSAGGYTALASLTFGPGVFTAGGIYYGVADLARLAEETHKFESRYLDTLIGPYPGREDLYRARSPINHVDRLSSPLIFFQGLDDHVVPPSQTRMMAEAVREKGLPIALLTFDGEQHGFRKEATIARCFEAELFFYRAVLGFGPVDVPPLLVIENVDRWKGLG